MVFLKNMKSMKIKLGYRVFLFAFVCMLFFYACEDELTGDIRTAEAIPGEWRVNEESENLGTSSYQVYIGISAEDSSKVLISNFYQLGYDTEVIGFISGNRIELQNNQEVSLSGISSYIIKSGSGTVSSDYQNIDWQYTIDDGSGNIDNVSAIYTKQ